MTTITIERELLDQVLAVLTKSSCAIGYESETEWLNVNSKIRAALAAPAAAPDGPDNPSWHYKRLDKLLSLCLSERAYSDYLDSLKQVARNAATAPEFPANWAQMIHYPECWDTAAYPELRDAIHEALAWSGCSVCKPATTPEPTTDVAVKRLSKALRDDLDYAWGWHCNIAMSAYDAGCPHDVANEGAARFMQLLAGVDTRKHPGFARTQTNPMDSPDARHAQELLAQDITIANMRERHAQELCAYQITVDKLRAAIEKINAACASIPEGLEGYLEQLSDALHEAHHGIGDKT